MTRTTAHSTAGLRTWLGGLLPGAKVRRIQSASYALEWAADNLAALASTGPLWVVLGDSTAQAIGASDRAHGYVLQVLDQLRRQRDPSWRVVNLSRTGARVADVLENQLPAMSALPVPQLVTCAIGANDLRPTRHRRLDDAMAALISALPPGSYLATLPQGLAPRRAEEVNDIVRSRGPARPLVVVDLWACTGPPWRGKFSADFFHPNDAGYRDWVSAFSDALGLA